MGFGFTAYPAGGGAGISSAVTVCDAAALSSWLGAVGRAPAGLAFLPPSGMVDSVARLAVAAPALGQTLRRTLAESQNPIQQTRSHVLFPQWCDQSTWAEEIHTCRAASFDRDVSERLRGLRSAQRCAGAGLWMTAVPGAGPAFSSAEWQLLLRFRCGAPCFVAPARCSGCSSAMDQMGDHALSCASNGLYRRHNHLRAALFDLSKACGWGPELEVALPNSTCRPADILLRSGGPRPVAVDITVSHPLRPSASPAVRAGTVSAAAEAEARKITASQSLCRTAGWDFVPFGYDAVGGIGPGARTLCVKLAKQTAMRVGREASECALSVGQHLSLALAKGRGEMLSAANPVHGCLG